MNELINITENDGRVAISARELHKALEATERFQNWFERYSAYGLEEGVDYLGCKVFNTLAKQELQDYSLTIDAAKQICMLQRSDKGKEYRAYLIKVEQAWNTPEAVLARALQMANKTIDESKQTILQLTKQNAELKPKADFATAILASKGSILIGELAKILKQNGIEIGEKRLFRWLRDNHYLSSKGEYYNIPTQRYMEMGLFELKKSTHTENEIMVTTTTTKVTPKGQEYFIQKLVHGIQEPALF